MPPPSQSSFISSRRTVLIAFAGVFVSLPVWDVFAVMRIVRAGGGRALLRRVGWLVAALTMALLGVWGLHTGAADISDGGRTGLWGALLLTLGLYVAAMLFAGAVGALLFVTGLFIRWMANYRHRVACVLAPVLGIGSGGLVGPVGLLLLLLLVILGSRSNLISLTYSHNPIGILLFTGVVMGLLAGLLVGRKGLQTWDAAAGDEQRVLRVVLAAGRVGYQLAGWVLGAAVMVEGLLGMPGLGGRLFTALFAGHVRGLVPLVLLLGVFHLRLIIHNSAADLLPPVVHNPMKEDKETVRWLYIAAAALLIALSLLWMFRNGAGPSALTSDPAALYAPASAAHPLGTDALGRDVQRRLWRTVNAMWIGALTGGAVAVGLGGAWGLVLAVNKKGGSWSYHLLRLPAEAWILVSPALVLALLLMVRVGGSASGVGTGVVVGLILIPRVAWGGPVWGEPIIRHSATRAERLRQIVLVFGTAALAVLQISVSVSVLGIGQTPGRLLVPAADVLAGAAVIQGGAYLWLTLNAALPALLGVWALDVALQGLAPVVGQNNLLAELLA